VIGQTISHYRVIQKLGAGGMGEVYLAEDTLLGRKIALKLLLPEFTKDEDRLRRFEQEARAVGMLNHPNILAIYDLGTHDGTPYLVSELLEGRTLRARLTEGALPARKAIDYAIQIASGLAATHEKGIIHRDLKPENLFLTRDGRVKILDFGLARIKPAASLSAVSSAPTASNLTDPGTVLGTVGYMSPEQVRGEKAEAPSDLFSFGCVLYEMASGQRAFARQTAAETMAAILKDEPPKPSHAGKGVPPELERIIIHCLEKDPAERFQSARDLAFDLKAILSDPGATPNVPSRSMPRVRPAVWATVVLALLLLVAGLYLLRERGKPADTAIGSLAVLPLLNASGDADVEYLSDGITESLINHFSQLSRLRVVARSTVFRYKGRESDPLKIGGELNVRAVLTGKVMLRGETLSIQVDLVDIATGTQLWGERYDRKLADILAVQDEIARQVLEKLRFKLKGEEQQRLAKRYTDNTEAYQLYLLGRFHWAKLTEEGVKKSIDCFNQALAKDPNYALAYFGLFDAYMVLGQIGVFRPNEIYPKALVYAEKALAADPTLPEAHFARGAYELFYGWNWAVAEQELKRAMEPNTNVGGSHDVYGQLLAAMGRFDEAIAENKRAVDFVPLSPLSNANLGWVYYYARQYDQAITQCRKALELDPNFFQASQCIGCGYGQQGKYQEAIAELTKMRDLPGGFAPVTSELGYVYAVSGQRAEAQKLLRELQERAKREFVDPYYIAIIHVGLGDSEQTFVWLNKAYEERSIWLLDLKVEPKFDRLRADPRFQDLLRRIGLVP
jgi:serine/threonine-protein kinase